MTTRLWGWMVFALLVATPTFAENGHAAWLRYAPLPPDAAARAGAEVPRTVYRIGSDPLIERAVGELRTGVEGMLARPLEPVSAMPTSGAVVIGTLASIRAAAPSLAPAGELPPDAFW